MFSFLSFGIFDMFDILLVAFVFFIGYRLLRGTVAASIFVGIFFLYMFWLLARTLNMEMTSTIIGQFMSVGILALLIVFQQEVRRFLQMLGSHYRWHNLLSPKGWFKTQTIHEDISESIVNACVNFSRMRTGALIVIKREILLDDYIDSGVLLKSLISQELLENIFFKNTPLHDGAVIMDKDSIIAARCILPVSDRHDIPGSMGLRHRAALGLSAVSDATIIVVSEETGKISLFYKNDYKTGVTPEALKEFIEKENISILNR